jgi:hypothetical protein
MMVAADSPNAAYRRRKLPRAERQAILAAAAALAEEDYRSDKDITGFDAFSEEELDDDTHQRSDEGFQRRHVSGKVGCRNSLP